MSKENFKELFLDELSDIFSAETQLVEALPKMADASESADLKDAFEKHLEETKDQVKRLEKIFKKFNKNPSSEVCEAMEGLIKEGDEIIDKFPQSLLRDAA